MIPSSIKHYAGGISVIDAGFLRKQMAACYLVNAGPELAFIEVGTNSSTPRLMKVLQEQGRKPEEGGEPGRPLQTAAEREGGGEGEGEGEGVGEGEGEGGGQHH